MAIQSSALRSRRALLAASLGGLAALAAQALGRPRSARGANGDAVTVGGLFTGTFTTEIDVPNTPAFKGGSTTSIGLWGASHSGSGVYAYSLDGRAVYGVSQNNTAVWGSSSNESALYGYSSATDRAATVGQAIGESTGLLGASGGFGPADLPAAPAKTGVYGYATQDSGSRGVWGRANAGRGLYGQATSGYGVYGTSSSGTAAYFKGGDGTGKALNAQGRVFFKTAGLATIGAGASSSGPIAAGVDLVSSSKILATLEGNPGAGVTLHRVTKSTAADTLTVHLTGPAANACKVAWFVIG